MVRRPSSSQLRSEALTDRVSSTIAYTQREKAALGLLRQRKVVKTEEVETAIWAKGEKPFSSRIIAAGVLRSLKAKAERNREAFRIHVVNSGRSGSLWEMKRK